MLRSVKRIVLIVNPRASHVTPELTTTVERELRAAGDVETRTTERGGHAIELAREAGREADAIVVFSGDGGYNEVVNGLENDVPVGFVPGGGTSVFARALGRPREARPAAPAVARAILPAPAPPPRPAPPRPPRQGQRPPLPLRGGDRRRRRARPPRRRARPQPRGRAGRRPRVRPDRNRLRGRAPGPLRAGARDPGPRPRRVRARRQLRPVLVRRADRAARLAG